MSNGDGLGISAILHGDSKAGKSRAAFTVPGPRLLLDAEAANRWLPGRERFLFWDPITQSPPAAPTAEAWWDTCVVIVRSWETFVRAYEWLNSGDHPFVSVIIDSITEIQWNLKVKINEGNMEQKFAYDQWDKLLVRMEVKLREFRDLTVHPTHPLAAVVITAMTDLKDGKWRPLLQGQAYKKIPYFFDLIGYVYQMQVFDQVNPANPPRAAHMVLTGFDPTIVAGERIGGLIPPIIENLNFSNILASAFPETYGHLVAPASPTNNN